MQVSYLPSQAGASAAPKECRTACDVCSPSMPSRDVGQAAEFMTSSRKSLDAGGWVQKQVCDPTQAQSAPSALNFSLRMRVSLCGACVSC